MDEDPLHDAVARQYERWTYPQPIMDLEAWRADNWQWFDPSHAHRLFWPDSEYAPGMEILVAGCGTNQAAVFALNNPQARVVGIDVSDSSLEHHRFLARKHGLANLELHRLPIEDAGTLGREFDLIVSTGVLHHLADPARGLRSLAGCLKADGVAALMLYARYGRIGVEMLQSVFRDLGLGQDDSSVLTVRDALMKLPHDHPVASYLSIAPDLQFDAGIVDTFLHGRERSSTVDDCLELVRSAGLVFQDLFFKAPYHPPPSAPSAFLDRVSALPDARQWSIMERINVNNGCHYFTACRPDRPRERYEVDFTHQSASRFVPFLRHRCGLDGTKLFRPDWGIPLDANNMAFVRLVDGRRTIAEIAAGVPAMESLPARDQREREEFAKALFHALWKLDFLGVGLGRSASGGS